MSADSMCCVERRCVALCGSEQDPRLLIRWSTVRFRPTAETCACSRADTSLGEMLNTAEQDFAVWWQVLSAFWSMDCQSGGPRKQWVRWRVRSRSSSCEIPFKSAPYCTSCNSGRGRQVNQYFTPRSGTSSAESSNECKGLPRPERHRGVRIELRTSIHFEKGKSHEPSFYAWNRLGKEHLFGARG